MPDVIPGHQLARSSIHLSGNSRFRGMARSSLGAIFYWEDWWFTVSPCSMSACQSVLHHNTCFSVSIASVHVQWRNYINDQLFARMFPESHLCLVPVISSWLINKSKKRNIVTIQLMTLVVSEPVHDRKLMFVFFHHYLYHCTEWEWMIRPINTHSLQIL